MLPAHQLQQHQTQFYNHRQFTINHNTHAQLFNPQLSSHHVQQPPPPPIPLHHPISLQADQTQQSFVHSNINYHHNKYSIEMMNVGGDILASGSNSSQLTVQSTSSGAAATAATSSVAVDHYQMVRSSSPGQSKMSDILKRKNAPKRKSQATTRSKSRNQDHHGEQSTSATTSVVQDLISKATALGKYKIKSSDD